MYNVLSAMFNALGRSKVPLYLLIFSSVLNVGLDLYLVLTLKMGVAGVAWATLIARSIRPWLLSCCLRGSCGPTMPRRPCASMCGN